MMRQIDKPMTSTIISLAIAGASLVFASSASAQATAPGEPRQPAAAATATMATTATPLELREDAPDRHVVVAGDTLWSIASRFLKDPWRWGELWNMNKDQIRSPHRIFPGDIVVINRRAEPGQPAARLIQAEQVTKLSPGIRVEAIGPRAIPAIPSQKIEPFLVRPFIVTNEQIAAAATIIETQENRVVIGAGNVAYVRGLDEKLGRSFQVFRPGEMLIDPDTKQPLGREAFYLGEVKVTRFGEVSTVEIVRSTQEIVIGDRLVPVPPSGFPEYIPRPPAQPVNGRIIGVYGRANVVEVAQYDIVTLNRGRNDGLEVGSVLAMFRNPLAERASNRPNVLWGRVGPSGSDAPLESQRQQREDLDMSNLRGDIIWGRVGPTGQAAPLGSNNAGKPPAQSMRTGKGVPEERYGVLMVFRTFDRVSYAIIMDTSRPVNVSDVVRNP
ncbi:MAG: LysM peptidoglycan-binding domain-containing protein [Rhodocyclaceae bacterium]|nr:LysM peptidoglycan-binding domain-containing protein [Rhodocyclaceae bacterium]MCA3103077.1 LysM peptidoglycan-binding domain-containing protein [Rhodocyclaceae bacterium]MCA3111358.1 LysM peptidoglycan-binding domain-containing protein [Rhodocyclaceae bacterium]MCA3115235.1 LysM peptidoglycan-binding domain-containing protein [Rhodocyclaceae bacterium]MCA3129434.1 LysM peptidoglycan-binding domain-containing protein [Rhodocyclaceae bacterium]